MSIRKDYIIKHIEEIAQFIAALAGKKADSKQEIMIDQSLAELTGLNNSLFGDPKNARILASVLDLISDHNQKALTARMLILKDGPYLAIGTELMTKIDQQKLDPKIKALLGP
jgi:hypothetical protein